MEGSVARLIRERVGGIFETVTSTVTVTTTSTRILRQNPERVGYLLINTGNSRVDLSFEQVIVTGESIPLGPGGGSLSVSVEEDFTMSTYPLFGQAITASSTVRIIEIVRVSDVTPGT